MEDLIVPGETFNILHINWLSSAYWWFLCTWKDLISPKVNNGLHLWLQHNDDDDDDNDNDMQQDVNLCTNQLINTGKNTNYYT